MIVGDPTFGDDNQSVTRGSKKFMSCNWCPYVSTHSGTFKRHLLTHTGLKPFVCDLCSKSFSRNHTLVAHAKTCRGPKWMTVQVSKPKG